MRTYSRRKFVKSAAGLAGTLATLATPTNASGERAPNNSELGLLYDATRCVGCKACMAACKRVNAAVGSLAIERAPFDSDGVWDAPADLSGSTRTIIKVGQSGARASFIKQSCMHCQKPACVSACPVKAMTKDPVTGIVDYRKSACIGCRYCQIACPFNIPKFQWDRTIPQIVKCDLCRSTNLQDKGIPACAETCPTGALTFGTRSELLKQAADRMREHLERYLPHIYGEHEGGGTNVLILAAVPFAALGLPTLAAQSPAELSEKVQHTIYKGLLAPAALLLAVGAIALRNQKRAAIAVPSETSGRTEQPSHGPSGVS